MKNTNHSICEEANFDRLYRSQVKDVYHFSYYKCGDKEQAEDIMQEAFIKLWENCAKVPFEKAKSFLFTVAKNLFLNKVSKKKVVLKFEQQIQNKTNTENPEFLLEEKEFHDQLEAAINQLPENQKTVFLLNRIDKLKYREIAELIGISQKAVEKRMSQALLSLRNLHKNI